MSERRGEVLPIGAGKRCTSERGEEGYCLHDLITGVMSERRGEERYCLHDLMTGVCVREERRGEERYCRYDLVRGVYPKGKELGGVADGT